MKKLLSVGVLLALVTALLPVSAFAALRGVWDPLTNASAFQSGLSNGCEQPSLRPGIVSANGGHASVERWYAFTTRSTVVGSETVRSIWQGRNSAQIGNPGTVVSILEARHPLKLDPTAAISYADPAWSPNGKYLAYIQTDASITQSAIYIQEYTLGTSVAGASTPVGAPLLVVPSVSGIVNRSPDWKPDGTAIVYSSSASGLSLDLWTVSVNPATSSVGVPTRVTFVDNKAEINPSWGSGNRIAYATNKYGKNVIEILDLDDMSVILAETNFSPISHNNPSWSSNGNSIYYDAPQNEDANNNLDIWNIELSTQSKCDIFFDNRGDGDPDASAINLTSLDGLNYNLFLCSGQGAADVFGGVNVWRGNPLSCAPPIALLVDISPSTINVGSSGKSITVTISMPAESKAAGYRAAVDIPDHGPGIPPGTEGIKNRVNIIPSPLFMGRVAPTSPNGVGSMINQVNGGEEQIQGYWDRKGIVARLVALGLVDQTVPAAVTGYSNLRGRQYQGFGYMRVNSGNQAGQVVRMEQNAPNPFNPTTKIRFAVAKPGFVNVRVYNVRGELVKTIASGNYGTGSHEATWDGSTRVGGKAATGVYFAKASVGDGKGGELTSDVIKMVMTK